MEEPSVIKIGGPEWGHCATTTCQIHGHKDVALITEQMPQPGRAINLRAMPYGGNSEPYR